MRVPVCSREQEVVEAISLGRSHPELEQHVRGCDVCRDVTTVARALHEEHAFALEDVRVPPVGLVWWRAELRARQDATRVAQRPLTFAHAFAGACAIGVGAALLGGMLPWVEAWLISIGELPVASVLVGAVIALAVATPVALYFVFSDK